MTLDKLDNPLASIRAAQTISILGSTGSIGQSTLDVLALHPEHFHVFALSANTRGDLLLAQCEQWRPQYAVLKDQKQADVLVAKLESKGLTTKVLSGSDGLDFIVKAEVVDVVMAAIVGAAGLQSTLSAVDAGKKVLLANKEALVMAGALFMDAVARSGAVLLPIDSEHNAIFQCLPSHHANGLASLSNEWSNELPADLSDDLSKADVKFKSANQNGLQQSGINKILLTGSGGPFRTLPLDEFATVTVEQACAHPNWSMGQKISVDSATMMNKGLELIEACWLFDCAPEFVDIVIHPQSVIHSMVEYADGSVLAQLGQPDMRTPIAHALAWPNRMESGVASLNWSQMNGLTFEEPDYQRFPALKMARQAAEQRGSAPIVLNAANEVAVEAFLQKEIPFAAITEIVANCLENIPFEEPNTIEAIQAIDQQARRVAEAGCSAYSVAAALSSSGSKSELEVRAVITAEAGKDTKADHS